LATRYGLPSVGGHVFISYSRTGDGAYVRQLADHLHENGIPVWYDREIIHGDRWTTVIRDKIDTCVAFVVVMTPDAERSEWVDIEIAEARHADRPILPLLLRGQRFFTLANVQYQDVTDGRMPGPSFTAALRALLPASTPPDKPGPSDRRVNNGSAPAARDVPPTPSALVGRYLVENEQLLGEWRRHWIFLVDRVATSILAMFVLGFLFIGSIAGNGGPAYGPRSG
jgi:hypothetical protein